MPIDGEIPFPEANGEQPPPGTYRGVLIKSVKNLGIVTSSTFKDKNGDPAKKPMIELELQFTVVDKLLVWKRRFTLTTSSKGALFPLFLAATGKPPTVGGPGAQTMQGKCVDLGIKHEPGQNGVWAKIEWATAPSGTKH
jgi:hypothetical protein